MKKLIYILLAVLPTFASAALKRSVVEERYLHILSKSFTDPSLMAPRSALYWSLCLGETSELSKPELSKRIAALETDSIARLAFFKRFNYYRAAPDPKNPSTETYTDIYLPEYKTPIAADKDMRLVHQLSREKPVINWDHWLNFVDYVNALGQDNDLRFKWQSCSSDGPDGPEKKIADVSEAYPQFPGGDAALLNFLQKQIEYPMMERDNDIQGKVIMRFIVCPDGHISHGEVIRPVSPGEDREGILITKMLPRFTPGTETGTAVPTYFNMPIVFKLQ